MTKFNISREERSRIRLLHLIEGNTKFTSDLLIEGKGVDGWFGKLMGGKKRKEEIYNDLVAKGAETKISQRDYRDNSLSVKKFANLINNLHRIFVNEKKIISLVKEIALEIEDLDILTKLAFEDSESSEKPETFSELLVASGNFKEGEKFQLDNILQTALSDLMKDREKLNLPKEGQCKEGENPYDKETEPDKWKWCQGRLNSIKKKKEQEYLEKKKNPLKNSMYGYFNKEQCEEFTPQGLEKDFPPGSLLCWDPNGEHPSRAEGNTEGRCTRCKKKKKVEESFSLNEMRRIIEKWRLKPLMEQKKGEIVTLDGRDYKIVDLIKEKLPETNIGQTFESAQYKLTDDSLNAVKDLANKMIAFFNDPALQGHTFEIELDGGASLVPIKDSTAKAMGIPGYQNLGADKRNLWLANKRAESVQKYLQGALNKVGITNVTIPPPTVKLGKTPWDTNKGADHNDYRREQFMKVRFVPTGLRTVLEELPSICDKGLKPQKGGQGTRGNNWRVYRGDGMRVDFGNGEGMITMKFDAYEIPDMFILSYNGKKYKSENPQTGKKGFVSNIFKPLSDAELEKIKVKLEEINTLLEPLEAQIEEAENTLTLGREELESKLLERLAEHEENLEKALALNTQKIEKYGFNIPFPIKNNTKALYKNLDQYIKYFFPYLNKNVPNVYFEDQLIEDPNFEERVQAYYNLKDEGEVDKVWFEKFFEVFPNDRDGSKKSSGYKKLRKAGKGKFDKDEIEKFWTGIIYAQKQQIKNEKKQLEQMQNDVKKIKKRMAKRKTEIQTNIDNEITKLEYDVAQTKEKINTLLNEYQTNKLQYQYNIDTQADVTAKGQNSTNWYNKKLAKKGFKEGIIGTQGSITFNKVRDENIGYLQVVAPLGGTAWEVSVKCGAQAEEQETTTT